MTEQPTYNGIADRLRGIAVQVAIRTGLLKKCHLHGDLYDSGQHDFQGASMVAAYLINQSDPLVAPFRGDRAALTDLMKSVCQTQGPGCPQCADLKRNGTA